VNCPEVRFFFNFEILERPSKVDNPIVSCLLLIAHDCIILFLPRSLESKIVLFPGLVTSIMAIISFPKAAIKIGSEKSVQ
jgi:hypothetical protein